MDIEEIRKHIPHRYPFLLIDRIMSCETNRIEARKNVTVNEPFFAGHFPDYPIMPGVLILEALAQACGVLLGSRHPENRNRVPLFMGIERARFRQPVRPGDTLRLVGTLAAQKAGISKFDTQAFVGDELVCEAVMLVGWGEPFPTQA
jgi:3-hydroxyacyl-[acyl-carrier-protein] dehydratase